MLPTNEFYEKLIQTSKYKKIKSLLKQKTSFALSSQNNLCKIFSSGFISSEQNIVIVVETEQSALRYKNDLNELFGKKAVIFPYSDSGIYDTNFPDLYRYSEQIKILRNINKYPVIILPVKAAFEKFPDKTFFDENRISLKVDMETDLSELSEKLLSFGYKRVSSVTDIGEFSIRGDTADIYGLDENPLRIELWGDTITDLRYFNPDTQRSIEKIGSADIFPVSKFIRSDGLIKSIDGGCLDAFSKKLAELSEEQKSFFKGKYEELKNTLSENLDFEGIDYYDTVFNQNMKTFFEFIPDDVYLIFDEYSELKNRINQISNLLGKKYEENLLLPQTLPLNKLKHPSLQDIISYSNRLKKVYFDNFSGEEFKNTVEFNCSPVPLFSANLYDAAEFILSKKENLYKVIISTNYENRVREILSEFEIPVSDDFNVLSDVCITSAISSSGGVSEDAKVVVLTDRELFNKHSEEITKSKRRYRREKRNENDIKPEDYVVHQIHGIGIFKGMSKIEFDGEEKDYLLVEYAGKDKLYIPAEQISFLTLYKGSGAVKPTLSRMGGTDWENVKSKVKKAVADVAEKLLRLYANRKTAKGYSSEPDTVWQFELEESFPYTETPDQMKAILETKKDMELEKPMDRLICGDVGFGKTEVAMRAIFKAVMSGKQAAMVVPTTVLAMQHYTTISERFSPFPVKVEVLSRFCTPKEIRKSLENIASGETDVVIGTHRLLQDDVIFKDLGLLVIDEEHKFGVNHKEKFKMLKKNIDVLNMSATPIPRTLYMALSGIRDISVIATPPAERLPVKTFVTEFNETIIKNAVNYELERDGQVFYLYNRVETIYEFGAYLQKILPNARIAIAHGKTDGSKLEKIMCDFREGLYDVLLCSAIVESGIDIKNANTMIIHNSDRFGLAQLYQLRGRVGRTDKQAYCYCLYEKNKVLTDDAYKRLKAIKEFNSFGSGYQIALRDIEIRGIGNLLGTKQHGKMTAVGFDTYCSLLEEAVNELQDIKKQTYKSSLIDINVTAYIPDEWVGSEEQKMAEYKRLSDTKTVSDADLIANEWKDRFSKLGEPVENLIKLVKLKILASNANINRVQETPAGIRIYTDFSPAEEKIIFRKLPFDVKKYIKFVKLPKACKDGTSVILLNNFGLNFNELFNILSSLFYYITEIISDYVKLSDKSKEI